MDILCKRILILWWTFFSSVSFASECESLTYSQKHIHICDCPTQVAPTNSDKEDPEEALRQLSTQNCLEFPIAAVLNNPYVEVPKSFFRRTSDEQETIKLDLQHLKAKTLHKMSDEKLASLLKILGKKKMSFQWFNLKKSRSVHKLQSNAAAALALMVAIQREFELLARMLALAPDEVLVLFDSKLAVLADFHFVTQALIKMTDRLESDKLPQMAKASSKLVSYYIRFWSQKKPKHLTPLLTRLVIKMTHIMKEDPQYEMNIRQRGILLGSLFAGSLYFSQEIKTKDEHRIWVIYTTSNLIWAATCFIGTIPLVSNVVSGIQGVISVAVVAAAAFYCKKGPRDPSPNVKEIEGNIELQTLDSLPPDSDQKRLDLIVLLQWMHATIHVNGFAD